jgi:hypothetical protein
MHLSLNTFGDPCISLLFRKGTKEIDKERKSVDEEIPSYYSIEKQPCLDYLCKITSEEER